MGTLEKLSIIAIFLTLFFFYNVRRSILSNQNVSPKLLNSNKTYNEYLNWSIKYMKFRLCLVFLKTLAKHFDLTEFSTSNCERKIRKILASRMYKKHFKGFLLRYCVRMKKILFYVWSKYSQSSYTRGAIWNSYKGINPDIFQVVLTWSTI